MAPTRPIFHEGQVLTAQDLNALGEYCDAGTRRLRILCVTTMVTTWVAALIALVAIRSRCGRDV